MHGNTNNIAIEYSFFSFFDPGGYWWSPTCSKFQLAHLDSFQFNTFLSNGTLLCNYGFCTFEVVLKPYTTSRWILVVAHLVQLTYFGSFHLKYIFLYFWGHFETLNNFFGIATFKLLIKSEFDDIMCISQKIPFQRAITHLKQEIVCKSYDLRKLMY
jgi:hypothetical protein